MRLLRLKLENFCSFAAVELDLNVDGVITVTGHNGAGKSTLVQAVEWALYGSRRGRGALPVRRDAASENETCSVELDFAVAGSSFTVRRESPGEAILTDRETQIELARDPVAVTSTITAILGLTRDVFEGTFYARQGEVQALNRSSAQERRKRLELLLGIERLRRAADQAASDARSQSTVVATLALDCPDVDGIAEEVERRRLEAQRAAPPVTAATKNLAAVRERHKAARAQVDDLGRREQEARKRQEAVTAAAESKASTEAGVETLRGQVARAEEGAKKAEQLQPLAARVGELTAAEREQDLRRETHERWTTLRDRQGVAMKEAAGLADDVATIPPADGTQKPPDEQLAAARDELDRVGSELRSTTESLTSKRARRDELTAALISATRGAEINAELTKIGDAPAKLESATGRLADSKAAVRQLGETIEHDHEHREQVATDGANATCPRCRRSYGEDWQSILDDFDRDLQTTHEKQAKLTREIEETAAELPALRDAASQLGSLSAERKALGPVGDLAELREQLTRAEREVEMSEEHVRVLDKRDEALREQIPTLQAAVEASRTSDKRRADLIAKQQQADQRVGMLAAELEGLGSNGYDPQAHGRLRDELKAATKASTTLAALQSSVDQLPLLTRQLKAAQDEAATAIETHRQAEQAVDEVAPPADAMEQARQRLTEIEEAVDTAKDALAEAKLQAEREDGAVAAAAERLKEARTAAKRLTAERREERMRKEVASALAGYRDHVASSAKPRLEREASRLLALVTRGRFASVEIGEDYSLRILDAGKAHPLDRFSGGEKDLANLCLRLALSKALAAQQGIEAGFVILDEVFGSQDRERQQLVLNQLRELGTEFRQVFLISHVREVVDYSDHHIAVEHRDGASVVEQASPGR